jgi:hypothetical protein
MNMEYETTTPVHRIEELSGQIKDYLRGYGRPDGKRLAPLVKYEAWRLAASAEIMMRCTRILANLDDETIGLIAGGQIDMGVLAADVADELGGL